MKKYILQSIRLTLVLMILLCVIYPLTIAFAGRFSKGEGSGEKLIKQGKVIGYALLGQSFKQPQYFWGRPSAVGYNAAGSGGSNKGPSNPDYLNEVAKRIDTLMKYHPGLRRSEIPADLITASGSGLDPDISVQAAIIQVKRIALNRKLTDSQVTKLLEDYTQKPLLGLFGPSRINVLMLNNALDEIK